MFGTLLIATTSGASGEFDIFTNILETRGVVLAVLIVLLVMSLLCWFIIAYKVLWFRRLRRASQSFTAQYWEADSPSEVYELARERADCPETRIFVAGFREVGNLRRADSGPISPDRFDNVERAVRRCQADETTHFERWVSVLATTGTTAPFIGLFGTVWGIMRAFAGIQDVGADTNLLTMVTPHIAEALVATAIGLLAAIPAVMGYNYFVNKIRRCSVQMETFSADYLNVLRRLYFNK